MYGKTHTPETRAQMSDSHTGLTHSEETRAQISDSISGANNPMYGKSGELSPVSIQVNVYSAVDNEISTFIPISSSCS
jgi:NUMOD3 motif